jgi:hypothetical protein
MLNLIMNYNNEQLKLRNMIKKSNRIANKIIAKLGILSLVLLIFVAVFGSVGVNAIEFDKNKQSGNGFGFFESYSYYNNNEKVSDYTKENFNGEVLVLYKDGGCDLNHTSFREKIEKLPADGSNNFKYLPDEKSDTKDGKPLWEAITKCVKANRYLNVKTKVSDLAGNMFVGNSNVDKLIVGGTTATAVTGVGICSIFTFGVCGASVGVVGGGTSVAALGVSGTLGVLSILEEPAKKLLFNPDGGVDQDRAILDKSADYFSTTHCSDNIDITKTNAISWSNNSIVVVCDKWYKDQFKSDENVKPFTGADEIVKNIDTAKGLSVSERRIAGATSNLGSWIRNLFLAILLSFLNMCALVLGELFVIVGSVAFSFMSYNPAEANLIVIKNLWRYFVDLGNLILLVSILAYGLAYITGFGSGKGALKLDKNLSKFVASIAIIAVILNFSLTLTAGLITTIHNVGVAGAVITTGSIIPADKNSYVPRDFSNEYSYRIYMTTVGNEFLKTVRSKFIDSVSCFGKANVFYQNVTIVNGIRTYGSVEEVSPGFLCGMVPYEQRTSFATTGNVLGGGTLANNGTDLGSAYVPIILREVASIVMMWIALFGVVWRLLRLAVFRVAYLFLILIFSGPATVLALSPFEMGKKAFNKWLTLLITYSSMFTIFIFGMYLAFIITSLGNNQVIQSILISTGGDTANNIAGSGIINYTVTVLLFPLVGLSIMWITGNYLDTVWKQTAAFIGDKIIKGAGAIAGGALRGGVGALAGGVKAGLGVTDKMRGLSKEQIQTNRTTRNLRAQGLSNLTAGIAKNVINPITNFAVADQATGYKQIAKGAQGIASTIGGAASTFFNTQEQNTFQEALTSGKVTNATKAAHEKYMQGKKTMVGSFGMIKGTAQAKADAEDRLKQRTAKVNSAVKSSEDYKPFEEKQIQEDFKTKFGIDLENAGIKVGDFDPDKLVNGTAEEQKRQIEFYKQAQIAKQQDDADDKIADLNQRIKIGQLPPADIAAVNTLKASKVGKEGELESELSAQHNTRENLKLRETEVKAKIEEATKANNTKDAQSAAQELKAIETNKARIDQEIKETQERLTNDKNIEARIKELQSQGLSDAELAKINSEKIKIKTEKASIPTVVGSQTNEAIISQAEELANAKKAAKDKAFITYEADKNANTDGEYGKQKDEALDELSSLPKSKFKPEIQTEINRLEAKLNAANENEKKIIQKQINKLTMPANRQNARKVDEVLKKTKFGRVYTPPTPKKP